MIAIKYHVMDLLCVSSGEVLQPCIFHASAVFTFTLTFSFREFSRRLYPKRLTKVYTQNHTQKAESATQGNSQLVGSNYS